MKKKFPKNKIIVILETVRKRHFAEGFNIQGKFRLLDGSWHTLTGSVNGQTKQGAFYYLQNQILENLSIPEKQLHIIDDTKLYH